MKTHMMMRLESASKWSFSAEQSHCLIYGVAGDMCACPHPLPISFSVSCNVLEILVKSRLDPTQWQVHWSEEQARHPPSWIFSHILQKCGVGPLWDLKFTDSSLLPLPWPFLSKKAWIHHYFVVPDPVLGWLFCPVHMLYVYFYYTIGNAIIDDRLANRLLDLFCINISAWAV